MFLKLFKHEWRESWKIPALLLIVTLLVSAAVGLYFSFQPPAGPEVELHVGNFLLYMAYAFLAGTSGLLLMLYIGVRFYKNLYTDEGYLMHTLPVKPWQLIAAKGVCALIWTAVLNLVATAAILGVSIFGLPTIGYLSEKDLESITSMFRLFFGTGSAQSLLLILYTFASLIFNILTTYTAISLGQLFIRHKVMASVLCYIGLSAILSTLVSLVVLAPLMGIVITSDASSADALLESTLPLILNTTYFVSFLVNTALSVAGFLLTERIMRRNLNLD